MGDVRGEFDEQVPAEFGEGVQTVGARDHAPEGESRGSTGSPGHECEQQGQGAQGVVHAPVVGTLSEEPSAEPRSGGEWVPAFAGQRPPFQPGHELSVQHGAYSPRKVDPLAEDLVLRVLADESVAYLRAAAYRPALWAWGRAEARCQLLEEFLGSAVGDLGSVRVQAAYRFLSQTEARAASLRSQLGLTPLARARLGKDVAQGAAADAAAALTRAREKAERRAQAPRTGADGGGVDG